MQSVSVSLYNLKITERRKSEPLIVDSFDGSTDLLNVILDALKEHQGNSVEIKGGTRRTYITNDIKKKDRIVDGRVEVGDSGFTASIKDVTTSKEHFKQLPTHASMIPLYIRFWVPSGERFALAALQHYGETGCKSSLNSILMNHFHQKYEDYSFRMRQVVPGPYAEEVMTKGAIKELRFIQYGVGSDIANMYGGGSLPPGIANCEMRIVARKENQLVWTDWLRRAVRGRLKMQKGPMEIDSFECDDFRMRVNINGKDKVVKIRDFVRLNSRMDISDVVEFGPDGHPKRRSIGEVCAGLMAQITRDDPGIVT